MYCSQKSGEDFAKFVAFSEYMNFTNNFAMTEKILCLNLNVNKALEESENKKSLLLALSCFLYWRQDPK